MNVSLIIKMNKDFQISVCLFYSIKTVWLTLTWFCLHRSTNVLILRSHKKSQQQAADNLIE